MRRRRSPSPHELAATNTPRRGSREMALSRATRTSPARTREPLARNGRRGVECLLTAGRFMRASSGVCLPVGRRVGLGPGRRGHRGRDAFCAGKFELWRSVGDATVAAHARCQAHRTMAAWCLRSPVPQGPPATRGEPGSILCGAHKTPGGIARTAR